MSTQPAAETFWAAADVAAALDAAGLGDVQSVMQSDAGHRLRTIDERENWRIELPHASAAPRAAYLKKHRERKRRAWTHAPAKSAGALEAENVHALAAAGVPSMELLAYGERCAEGERQSFVLTAELAGYTQLDHYLRQSFAPYASEQPRHDARLDRLLDAVADVARHFHQAGFNHRDFYGCHFFVRETTDGTFDVRLIDLQRVERRRWFRQRWVIKDLAQLAYSAPLERVAPTRLLRFIKRYLGVKRLGSAEQRLIRAVWGKRQRMIERLGAHP